MEAFFFNINQYNNISPTKYVITRNKLDVILSTGSQSRATGS